MSSVNMTPSENQDEISDFSDIVSEKDRQAVLNAKSVYNKIGFGLLLFLASSMIVQFIAGVAAAVVATVKGYTEIPSTVTLLLTFLPLYAVGIPLLLLMVRGISYDKKEKSKLGAKGFVRAFFICFFFSYSGNLLATLMASLISGGSSTNPLNSITADRNPLIYIYMVILAPVFEELVFRKLIIDRTSRFGEKTAVIFSALAFSLFHTNLYQMVYAFTLGALFGYIYTRTRRIHYTMLLHGIVNLFGTVIGPFILRLADLDALAKIDASSNLQYEKMAEILPGLLIYLAYFVIYMGFVITGLVLFVKSIKRQKYFKAEEQLPTGSEFKTIYLRVGVIIYAVFSLIVTLAMLFI